MKETIQDFFTTIFDFTNTLENAEENANNAWETEFVENIRANYEAYGKKMFLSERQAEQLKKIANATTR